MRIRRGATVVVAAALALAGCGGGDGGSTVTSSTPTPTGPGSSSSSSPPTRTASPATSVSTEPPAEAKADTKEGAEAFAKWYWEQLGSALHTGDTATLRKYSGKNCDQCAKFIKKIDDRRAQGRRADRDPYAVQVVKTGKVGDSYLTSLKVAIEKYEFVDEAGTVQGSVKATNYAATLETQYVKGEWRALYPRVDQ